MSKEKTRTIIKPVGVAQPKAYSFCKEQSSNRASILGDPHFEEIAKNNKGITLIALIITIIVMLILVGVSVTVALNGGLFSTAQKATADTEMERDKELALSDGTIEINGKKYLSIEDYRAGIERAPDIMGGKGTETNPYTIDSIEALVQFAHSVTNGKTYEGEYVKLTRNLDFESTDSYIDATRTDYEEYGYTGELITALTTGEGWQPIGSTIQNDDSNSFKGIFDGNGKNINNLLIDRNIQSLEQDILIGFFSSNYGIIKNLGITNANIKIIAKGDAGKSVNIGAVTGYSSKEVNGCYTTGTVYTETHDANTTRLGGIASYTGSNASIINCYNNMDISTKHSSTGGYYVGGVIGYVNANSTLNGCYNAGEMNMDLNTTTAWVYCGGITGYLTAGSNICNNYNLATLTLDGTAKSNLYFGGILGHNRGSISNVCNSGNVMFNLSNSGSITLVGGVAGQNFSIGKIENSYFLSSTSTVATGKNSGTANISSIDKIENMPTVLEIVGNGFKADTNNINNGYPILSWQ